MTTRCKFVCVAMTKRKHWNPSEQPFNYDAKFQAVSSGSEENKKFFVATPAGELSVTTLHEDSFAVGKEYYLDLTLVG